MARRLACEPMVETGGLAQTVFELMNSASLMEFQTNGRREDLNLRPPGPRKKNSRVVVNVFNLLQRCFNRLVPAQSSSFRGECKSLIPFTVLSAISQ